VDVEVSSDEEVVPGPNPDALADQKKASAGDGTVDEGVSSTKPNAPNPISSSAPKQSILPSWVGFSLSLDTLAGIGASIHLPLLSRTN
jgi:hypothetical protein